MTFQETIDKVKALYGLEPARLEDDKAIYELKGERLFEIVRVPASDSLPATVQINKLHSTANVDYFESCKEIIARIKRPTTAN